MSKLKSFFGYTIAFLGIPIVLATLMGMDGWMQAIAGSGLVVSPLYSGGEVAQTIQHTGYHTSVHDPVFAALIGESNEGFVQVTWQPKHQTRPGSARAARTRVCGTSVLSEIRRLAGLDRNSPEVLLDAQVAQDLTNAITVADRHAADRQQYI